MRKRVIEVFLIGMLCSVHTPVGAILVNDELIKASNGKIYRWIEE